MNYADVKSYTKSELLVHGARPIFHPGPATLAALQKLGPQQIVFLAVGGGPGLSLEAVYDRVFIDVHAIGKQNDYDDAEQLAEWIDQAYLSLGDGGSSMVGSAGVLYITRTGGRPVLAGKDSADRYHFTCSYVTETPTGL